MVSSYILHQISVDIEGKPVNKAHKLGRNCDRTSLIDFIPIDSMLSHITSPCFIIFETTFLSILSDGLYGILEQSIHKSCGEDVAIVTYFTRNSHLGVFIESLLRTCWLQCYSSYVLVSETELLGQLALHDWIDHNKKCGMWSIRTRSAFRQSRSGSKGIFLGQSKVTCLVMHCQLLEVRRHLSLYSNWIVSQIGGQLWYIRGNG
jgi:hypothetical protein